MPSLTNVPPKPGIGMKPLGSSASASISKPEVYKVDRSWEIPMDGHRPSKIK